MKCFVQYCEEMNLGTTLRKIRKDIIKYSHVIGFDKFNEVHGK